MKKVLLIVLILAAAGAGWWWWAHRAPAEAEAEIKPTPQVQTIPLKRQAISETVTVLGTVEAAPTGVQVLTLGYDCLIKSVAVGAGARVGAGEEIMVVGPTPDAAMQLDSARADAALADKVLASARSRYDLKLATSQDLLTAQQAAEDAQIKWKSFQARGLAGDGRILAPASGVVAKLDGQPGQTVPAGTALVTVTSDSGLEAKLGAEASDAARLQPGQPAQLTPVSRSGGEAVAGKVRIVGASVDPVSGAAEVRIPLEAAAGWFPGEHVQADIEVASKTGWVVPRSAVLPDDDALVLYTVAQNKAVRHTVQTGLTSGEMVEVIAPELHAGDAVVTVGNYELEDGMAVQPATQEAKP